MNIPLKSLKENAVVLLKDLISTPSFSREENITGNLISQFFQRFGIEANRSGNNIWAQNKFFDHKKPNLLLNSHHDTVKPNQGYSQDPFQPLVDDGKLYGLGSNDAGGSLVGLIAAFINFYDKELPYNLIMAASAEEEISGKDGMESLIRILPEFELAIVGEPTQLNLAVAEKGLLVIDAVVYGKAGHAAREEGENAIYKALDDLLLIRDFTFGKNSEFLGMTKVSATVIHGGNLHNVIPDRCNFTLDVRVTDAYTLEEAFQELKNLLKADLKPRSMRLRSSSIEPNHKIISVANNMGLTMYGSPTLSDQALIPYPSVKIGPGDSARSHTADEFIYLKEIEKGINLYIQLLQNYFDQQ